MDGFDLSSVSSRLELETIRDYLNALEIVGVLLYKKRPHEEHDFVDWDFR